MEDQILATINRKLTDAHFITQEAGMSSGNIRLLYQLYVNGPMRVTVLAAALDHTQQAIGKALTQLQQQNMVAPVDDVQGDHRARPMKVTQVGIRILADVAKVWK